MSITKNGQLKNNKFIEGSSLFNLSNSFSYTPANNTNNSCASAIKVDLSSFVGLNTTIQLHIELDFTWGDFSSGTGTGGTFSTAFQGAQYAIGSTTAVWEGSNYIASALNSARSTLTCINNANTGGTYHYSTYCTIPASWFDTYEGSQLSFRTNYSNGIGTISVTNVKIMVGSTTIEQAHFANNYISGNNFYEY